MDNVGDNLSPRGLFLFREHYYPKKPNLSKIFSYLYIVFALALIIAYCSPINGLRCSTQTYVSACEKDIITSDQCNNLLIVDCELDCDKKGLSLGMTCDYEPCRQGDQCWQQGGGGGGGGGGQPQPPGPQKCGPDCEYGKTGYYITISSVTGPSTCQNYLNLKDSINSEPGYNQLKNDKPGLYPAMLGSCCGVLKTSVVCLSPSAVIGVVGGYLSILLSIFQVLFIFVSKFKKSDVFKKRMGDYEITDPFMDFKKISHKDHNIRHDVHHEIQIQHHKVNNNDDVEHHIEMADIYHNHNEPKEV